VVLRAHRIGLLSTERPVFIGSAQENGAKHCINISHDGARLSRYAISIEPDNREIRSRRAVSRPKRLSRPEAEPLLYTVSSSNCSTIT